ncbi:MAG: DUF5685 family protein [Planctomycetota bacterium]|nr:DUF5685 family protein [Planctomycetota bacterium]
MFGTLKPHKCTLDKDNDQNHWRFYCGLCKSLGDDYSQAHRALVNFDAVFIGIVADGLLENGAEHDSCRCPINPLAMRPTMTRQSPAMKFATSMQMLLSDQWLADRGMDGRSWARASRRWFRPALQKARRTLANLGLSMAQLEGFERVQKRVEVIGKTSLSEAAEPTARALGYVFRQVAALPGAVPQLAHETMQSQLNLFGRSLGRVIYLTDAIDDLEKDLKNKEFNPCLQKSEYDGSLKASKMKIQDCHDALARDFDNLNRAVDALPWRRHKALIKNILCDQLVQSSQQASKKLQAWICKPDQNQLFTADSPSKSVLSLSSFLCKISNSSSRQPPESRDSRRTKILPIFNQGEKEASKFELIEDGHSHSGPDDKQGPNNIGAGDKGGSNKGGGGQKPPNDDDPDFEEFDDDETEFHPSPKRKGEDEQDEKNERRSFPSRGFCFGTTIGFFLGVVPAAIAALKAWNRSGSDTGSPRDPRITCFENGSCQGPSCIEQCWSSSMTECSTCCSAPCKDCQESFSGCGDACSGCGKGCGDCGSGCDSCGKSCNGCGSGCDSCGKGCGDCGSCCSSSGSNGCGQCDCGTCCKAQYDPGFHNPIIDNVGSCSPF